MSLTVVGGTDAQQQLAHLHLHHALYDFGFHKTDNTGVDLSLGVFSPDFGEEFVYGFFAEWRVVIALDSSESDLRDDGFSRARRPYGDVTYIPLNPFGEWRLQVVGGVSDRRMTDTIGHLLGLAVLMERVRGRERQRLAQWFDTEISGGDSAGVPSQVASVGVSMGASDRHLLVAMMVGLVEAPTGTGSFDNPRTGTADSVGWRQERLSIYGPSAYDVQASATRFFTEVAAADTGQSLGDLAQAVQNSAFPDRYAAVEDEARALLARVQINTGWADLESSVAEAFKGMFWIPEDRIDEGFGGFNLNRNYIQDFCEFFNCRVPCMGRWPEIYGMSSTNQRWLGPYSRGAVRGGFLQTSKPEWMSDHFIDDQGQWRGLGVPNDCDWIDFEGDFRSNEDLNPTGPESPTLSVGFGHCGTGFLGYLGPEQPGPLPFRDADFSGMIPESASPDDRPWFAGALARPPRAEGESPDHTRNTYPDETHDLTSNRGPAWMPAPDLPEGTLEYLFHWREYWHDSVVEDPFPFGFDTGNKFAYPWQDPDNDDTWGVAATDRGYSPKLFTEQYNDPHEAPLADRIIRFTMEAPDTIAYTRGTEGRGPDYQPGAVWNNLPGHLTYGRGQFGIGNPQFSGLPLQTLLPGLGQSNHSGSFEMELCNPPGWTHPLAARLWVEAFPLVPFPPPAEALSPGPIRQHSQWPLLWRILRPPVNYWQGLPGMGIDTEVSGGQPFIPLDPAGEDLAAADALPMGRGYFADPVRGPFGFYYFSNAAFGYQPTEGAPLANFYHLFATKNWGSSTSLWHKMAPRPWYRAEPQLKWRFSIRVNGNAPGYLAHYWNTSALPGDPDPIEDGPYYGKEAMEWRIRSCPCSPAGPPGGGGPPPNARVPGEVTGRGGQGQARRKTNRPYFPGSVG